MRLAALATILLLAACQRGEPPEETAAASQPVNPDPQVTTYVCEDGQTVVAGYPDATTATLTYKDHSYTLKSAMAASGVRYVGYGLQWWTKGMEEGTLSPLKPGEEVASAPGVRCTAGQPSGSS